MLIVETVNCLFKPYLILMESSVSLLTIIEHFILYEESEKPNKMNFYLFVVVKRTICLIRIVAPKCSLASDQLELSACDRIDPAFPNRGLFLPFIIIVQYA